MEKQITDNNGINDIKTKILKYINNYYHIIIGAFFVALTLLNYFVRFIPLEYSGFLLLTAFICFTVVSDINRNIKIKGFLILAIPYLTIILVIFASGNDLWHRVLRWELSRGIIFNINSIFDKIPFNDAAFTRIIRPDWFTYYMKLVYNTGFVLAVIVPLFRAALALDLRKMLKYTLSAHIFQVLIITPFYIVFFLQEVWYVRGNPDVLARVLTPQQTVETVVNCFPSMHTSIAFAMFLLVIRERNKLFKWVWGIYCISVIYSTMYLEIHWVIDVVGGLILGYGTVKLADYVIVKGEAFLLKRFKFDLLKNKDTIIYEE